MSCTMSTAHEESREHFSCIHGCQQNTGKIALLVIKSEWAGLVVKPPPCEAPGFAMQWCV